MRAPDLVVVLDHIVAEDPDRTLAGQQERGQDLDEGGLPRAVRPEEAEELALVDLQGDVVQRLGRDLIPFAPENTSDVVDLYGVAHGLHHMVDVYEELLCSVFLLVLPIAAYVPGDAVPHLHRVNSA